MSLAMSRYTRNSSIHKGPMYTVVTPQGHPLPGTKSTTLSACISKFEQHENLRWRDAELQGYDVAVA